MKTLCFMPLAFLAGPEGFAMFAPYLAFALALTHWSWTRRRNRLEAEATIARESLQPSSVHCDVAFPV